ncbi:unnamed protein product [Sphagnum troendelagicum]
MGSVAATSSSWKDSPLAFPSSSSSCNPNRFNNNTPCSTSSSSIKCLMKWVSAAKEIGSNTPKHGKKITCKKESSSSSELRTHRSLHHHHHHLLLPLRHSHSFITHSSPSSSGKTKKKLPRQLVKTRFEEEDKEECASPPPSPPPPPPPLRPPFDLDLAVLLAGFAFEAYNTPKANVGLCERNAGDYETIFLAKQFVREIYDGQLFVKLKGGSHFPGLDPWGTSDPYVILRIGDCEAQSQTIWGTRDPVWNEDFKLNVKNPTTQILQVAAWDANIITAHRRMGNSSVNLESFCDGKKHQVDVELGGIGKGGALQLEVQYRSFVDLDADKSWWQQLPFVTDLFQVKELEEAFVKAFGSDGIRASDFARSILSTIPFLVPEEVDQEEAGSDVKKAAKSLGAEPSKLLPGNDSQQKGMQTTTTMTTAASVVTDSEEKLFDDGALGVGGVPFLDQSSFDAGQEATRQLSLELQMKADEEYVLSGLAQPEEEAQDMNAASKNAVKEEDNSSALQELKEASFNMWRSTEELMGSLAMVASSLSGSISDSNNRSSSSDNKESMLRQTELYPQPQHTAAGAKAMDCEHHDDNEITAPVQDECQEDQDAEEREATRRMFETAESAVEAWAMLATSLGGQSFVKSEFQKICFVENKRTDTQVAIWRDMRRHRLVVAFRGTEQTKLKDLMTDLNVIPVGFDPERGGGNYKEEAMVHGGFLDAYDSVRHRLLTLVEALLGTLRDDAGNEISSWHVYLTGHSLGGALATLFAVELSSKLAKSGGQTQITMYNFGSPRVGNKQFADMYNERVRDSWRVVNHRDIIPTVPRLMGYCHIGQPVYLSAGTMNNIVENEILEDGYQGDVIGEITPDLVIENFMRGERQIIERLLQTEIAMLRAIRDGSALMQHMEDFYYIALLEQVERKMK